MTKTGEITQRDYMRMLRWKTWHQSKRDLIQQRKWRESKFKCQNRKKADRTTCTRTAGKTYTHTHTKKEKEWNQKRECEEKSILRSRIYALLINAKLFSNKLKSLFDKKETRTRCGRLYFASLHFTLSNGGNCCSVAFPWLELRENIRLFFSTYLELTPATSYVHMNECTTQTLFMCAYGLLVWST